LVFWDTYDLEAFIRLCDRESDMVIESTRLVAAATIATITKGKESMETAVLKTLVDNSEDNTKDKEMEGAGERDTLFINCDNLEMKKSDLDS
jgi:hypothetical protein